MPQYSVDVIREVFDLLNAGRTQGEISRQTKIPQPTISRWVHNRRLDPPKHTSGIPAVSPVTPHGIPDGIPDIARQTDLDALRNRVEVLEAFIATFQQRGIPVSPNGTPGIPYLTSGIPRLTLGTPTKKHSCVFSVATLDAIQRYAAAHHAQVKDALDYLVRTGLAAVGEEVGDA